MRKTKAKLILTLGVALLSVLTMGVSTFAWFQATASATVETSSTSTNITVAKPDDYTFYAFNGNDDYTFTRNGTFSHDFTALNTSEAIAAATSLSGLGPGQQMTYAIEFTGKTSATLTLTKIISNDTAKENTYREKSLGRKKIENQNVNINVGWAMDIYTGGFTGTASNAATGYTSYIDDPSLGDRATNDKFKYSYSTNRSALETHDTGTDVITLANGGIQLFQNNSISYSGYTHYYLFYSVVFSNASDTFYQEVQGDTGNSSIATTTPALTSARYFRTPTAAEITAGTANSNCYEYLTFALNTVSLVFA